MSTAASPASSAAATPQESVVLPPLRRDLVITQQRYEGRTYFVVKDPISLQYFRLTAEDYRLATLFDGVRTFRQIREEYARLYPHVLLDHSAEELNERLLRFSNDLALLQFLSVQGQRLKQRWENQKQQKKKHGKFSLYKFANQLFFARFSVFDPDVLFGRMAKPLWWMWTKPTLWISTALIALAAFLFVKNFGQASPSWQYFFSLNNIALLWVLTIIIKSIHELGHGLTCKHFGSEVHEVGAMVLVFTPYFFVNVSDSWVMPKRMHRILVSAAGIYVELIIAAFATFAWVLVQPGFLQMVLYNVIIIASISTLIFNANPLMRFDGYYIMTDLLEVPNLQTKSRALISYQVKRLLFGRSVEDPVLARMPLPKKRFWLFYIYAVLSFLYGYYVIYKLAEFMGPHLAPFGLEGLAHFLSALALIAWVVMPLIGFFKSLHLTRADWQPHGKLRRLATIGGVTLVVFAALCFWPKELTIRRSISVELAAPETVRTDVAGMVTQVYVHEGQIVAPGAPLALLQNREVRSYYLAASNRVQMADAMINRAMGLDKPSELVAAQMSKTQAEGTLRQATRDRDRLVLRSEKGGTVLTRNLDQRTGQMLKSGELFCEVAPLAKMRIKVPLTEHEVRWVQKGQRVELKTSAYTGQTLTGVIAENPVIFIQNDLPASYSERREGDVRTGVDMQGKEVPLDRTFEATIEIDNRDGLLRPGMTGRAQIEAGRHAFGKLLLQSALDLLSLDFRF